MQLGSDQGPSVEFEVLGYEFPAAGQQDSWDANWLNIEARIRLEDGRAWEFTHPCLTTFEAAQLGSWLRGLGDVEGQSECRSGANRGDRLLFTEPLLAFEAETTAGSGLESESFWTSRRGRRGSRGNSGQARISSCCSSPSLGRNSTPRLGNGLRSSLRFRSVEGSTPGASPAWADDSACRGHTLGV